MVIRLQRLSITISFQILALAISLSGCGKSEKNSIKTFATPDDAGNALLAVAKTGDQTAIPAIFGPGSEQVILSGDSVEDKNAAKSFVTRYGEMHRWRKLADGSQMLLVGADNYPFPIPLRKNAGGQWYFDTTAGKEELLNRRVGRNELEMIDACRALAGAQAAYFSRLHDGARTKQYAVKFISDPGKQNGLYWQSSTGEPQSPLGPLVAYATSEGYTAKPDAHLPFHGYYFHMLNGQTANAPGGKKSYIVDGHMVGGFAFVAYPAEYGNSGVMTFMINQNGVLLEKDLGKDTVQIASAMREFDPDTSWRPVQE